MDLPLHIAPAQQGVRIQVSRCCSPPVQRDYVHTLSPTNSKPPTAVLLPFLQWILNVRTNVQYTQFEQIAHELCKIPKRKGSRSQSEMTTEKY